MPKFNVRILRSYEEEFVDIDVEASSAEAAKNKALKEARSNACLYFGATPEPEYSVDSCETD